MKYFVKYQEWCGGRSKVAVNKTKFFTSDDIEKSWGEFVVSKTNLVDLLDITRV